MSLIEIYIPNDLKTELEYCCNWIFGQRMGLDIALMSSQDRNLRMHNTQSGKSLNLQVDALRNLIHKKIEPDYLPVTLNFRAVQNLEIWTTQPRANDENRDFEYDLFLLPFDILSSYFFLRNGKKDKHSRIVSWEHLLVSELLKHPLVDRQVEALVQLMISKEIVEESLIEQKQSEFTVTPSHDVDRPFLYLFRSYLYLTKRVGGDVLLRKSLSLAHQRINTFLSVKRGNYEDDPNNVFTWILDTSRKLNLINQFNFLTDRTQLELDADYSIEHPAIKDLLKRVNLEGHTIGIHPSYNSLGNEEQIRKELQKLQSVCGTLDIEQVEWGGRKHYLRWDIMETPGILERSGFDYDSTLTFPDRAGFRCGTSHPFSLFDLKDWRVSQVIEYPLIVMEQTIFNKKYMGIDNREDAFDLMKSLKDECRRFQGNFTLLWHNNMLIDARDKEVYTSILKA